MLGAHVSIQGGLYRAVERGQALGCDAIQIFSKNQRQWKSTELDEQSIKDFHSALKKSTVREVVIHASYLINLASPDKDNLEKSRRAMLDEVQRASQLNVPYVVVHPGAWIEGSEAEGIGRIIRSLKWIFSNHSRQDVTILLENTSGQGTQLGRNFQQLHDILAGMKENKNVGICFDTAHAMAAGIDLLSDRSYDASMRMMDQTVGLEKIRVLHLNDSKHALGSLKDRHENIGCGEMGQTPFRRLVNDKQFLNCPMILETPGGDDMFMKNLELLRSF